jgi:hypothetical protein
MIEAGVIGLRLSPIATGFWTKAKAEVKAQRSESAQMKVTADIGRASTEMAAFRIREQANAINLRLKVDESSIRAASEKVRYIEHTWSQSPIKKAIRVNVYVAGAVALPALTQGIMSLTAAITELGRASLILPGLFSGLAATIGTVATGIRGVGAALKASNDGMQQSEQYARSYARATRSLEDAQRGVVKALKDANREIQDQKDKLAQGELSVEQAKLNVIRANQEVFKARGFLEYKEALLGVKQANLDLSIAVKQNTRDVQDYYESAGRGISQNGAFKDSIDSLSNAVDNFHKAQFQAAGMSEQFISAMKQLSPVGQDFVLQLLKMRGSWKDLQNAVQDDLFRGLGNSVTELANKQLPLLKSGMKSVAQAVNFDLKSLLKTLGSEQNSNAISKIFERTGTAIKAMEPGINSVTNAFMHLSEVGSRFLPRLSLAFNKVTARFENFLKKADADGSLERWIDRGLDLVSSLGRSLMSIGSILGSVTDAYNKATGNIGGFASTMERGLTKLSDYLKSPAGKSAMISWMRDSRQFLSEIKQSLPGIRELFKVLGDAARDFATTAFPVFANIGQFMSENARFFKLIIESALILKTVMPIYSFVGKQIRNVTQAFSALKAAQLASIVNQNAAWKQSFDAGGMKYAAQQRISAIKAETALMGREMAYAREKRDWSKNYLAQAKANTKAARDDAVAAKNALSSTLIVPGASKQSQASLAQKNAQIYEQAKLREAAALKQFQQLDASFDEINRNRAATTYANHGRMSKAYRDLRVATNLAREAEENLARVGKANSGASGWMNRMKMSIGARTGTGLAGSLGVLAASFGGVVTAIGSVGVTVGAIYAFDQLTAAQNRNKAAADNLNDSQKALSETLSKGTGSVTSATLEETARQLKDRPNPVHPDDRGQNFDAAKILESQMGIKLDEAVRLSLPTETKTREERLAPGDARIIAAVPGLDDWKNWGSKYRKNGVDEGVYGRALNGVPEDIAKVRAARQAIRDASGAESWMPDGFLEATNRIPKNLGAVQEQLPRSGEGGGLRGLSLALGATRGIAAAAADAGRGLQEAAEAVPQKGLSVKGLSEFGRFGPKRGVYNPDGTATVEVQVYPGSVDKGWIDAAAAKGISVERRYPAGGIITIDKEHARDYFNIAPGYARGGAVWGAGTATSDSIPAMLSNGEFVINARSASLIGHDNLHRMNKMRSIPGFAPGGPVKRDGELIGPAGSTDNYWPRTPIVTPEQAAGNPMSQTLPNAIGLPTTASGSLFGPGMYGRRTPDSAVIPPNTLPEILGPYRSGPMTPTTGSGGRRHPTGHPKPPAVVPGLTPPNDPFQTESDIHGTGSQPGPGGAYSAPGQAADPSAPGRQSAPPAAASPGGWTPEEMEIAKGLAADTANLEGYKQILEGNAPSSLSPGTKAALGSLLGASAPAAPPISPGPGPAQLTSTAAERILNFADSVAGKIPYVWGGYSMGGMDCSGLALAMANIAVGKDPFDGGKVATNGLAQRLTQMGFRVGKPDDSAGALTVGWVDNDGDGPGGHAGVTLPNGVGLEAQNDRAGILMGNSTPGANNPDYTNWMYLPLGSIPSSTIALPDAPQTLPGAVPPFGIGNYPFGVELRPPQTPLPPPLPDVAAAPVPALPPEMFGPVGNIDPIMLLKQVGISLLEGLLGIFGINIDLNEIFAIPALGQIGAPTPQAGPDDSLLSQMDSYIEHYDAIGDKANADAMRRSKDDYLKPFNSANMASASEDLAKYFEGIGQPDRAAQIRAEAEKMAAAATAPPQPPAPTSWALGGLIPKFSTGGDFDYDQWVEDNYGPPILTAFGPGKGGSDLSHIRLVFPEENAAGGYISGPGTATSDSIPAMLSDGEFVMRAAAVDHWGVDRLQAMNKFSTGGPVGKIPGFAPGGSVDILDILNGGGDPNYTGQPLLAPIALADPTIATRQLENVKSAQAELNAATSAATNSAVGNYTGAAGTSDSAGRDQGNAVFGARSNLVEQTQLLSDMNSALADMGQYQGMTSIPGMLEGRRRNRFDSAGSSLPAELGIQSYPLEPSQWAKTGRAVNAITSPSWYLDNIPGVDMGTKGWNTKLKTPFEIATGYESPDWAQLSSKELLDSFALPDPYPIAKTYQNWRDASGMELGLATLGAAAFVPLVRLPIPGGTPLPKPKMSKLGLGPEISPQEVVIQSEWPEGAVAGNDLFAWNRAFPQIGAAAEGAKDVADPLGIPTMYPGSVSREAQIAMALQRVAGLQQGRIARGGIGKETLSIDKAGLDESANMRVILEHLYSGWDATHSIPPEMRDEWIAEQFTKNSGLFTQDQMDLLREYTGPAAVNPLLREQSTNPLSLLDVTENMMGRNAWQSIMRDVPQMDAAMDTAPRTATDAVVTRMVSPAFFGLPDNFAEMLASGKVDQDLLDSILGKDFSDPGYMSMALGRGYRPTVPGGGIPGSQMGIVSILPGGSRGIYLSAAEGGEGLSGMGRSENEILGPRGTAISPFRFALVDPSDPSKGFYAFSEMSQPAGIAPLPRFSVPDLNDMMEMSRFEDLAKKLGVSPEELSAKLGIPMPGASSMDLGSMFDSGPESITVSTPKPKPSDPLADLPMVPVQGNVNKVFTGNPNNYEDSWYIKTYGREAYDKFMEENPYVKPIDQPEGFDPKQGIELTGNPDDMVDSAYIKKYGQSAYDAALAAPTAKPLDQFAGPQAPSNSAMDEIIQGISVQPDKAKAKPAMGTGTGTPSPHKMTPKDKALWEKMMAAKAAKEEQSDATDLMDEVFPPGSMDVSPKAFAPTYSMIGKQNPGGTPYDNPYAVKDYIHVEGAGDWATDDPAAAAKLAAAFNAIPGATKSLTEEGELYKAYYGDLAMSLLKGQQGYTDGFLDQFLTFLDDPQGQGLDLFKWTATPPEPVPVPTFGSDLAKGIDTSNAAAHYADKFLGTKGSMISSILSPKLLRPDLMPDSYKKIYDPKSGGLAETYLGQPGDWWLDKIQDAIDSGPNGSFLGMPSGWWEQKLAHVNAMAGGAYPLASKAINPAEQYLLSWMGRQDQIGSNWEQQLLSPDPLPDPMGYPSNKYGTPLGEAIQQNFLGSGFQQAKQMLSTHQEVAKGIKGLTVQEQQVIGALLPAIAKKYGAAALKYDFANDVPSLAQKKVAALLDEFYPGIVNTNYGKSTMNEIATGESLIPDYQNLGDFGVHPSTVADHPSPGSPMYDADKKMVLANAGIVDGEINLVDQYNADKSAGGESSGYGFGVKLYNTLMKKPGALQSWLMMSMDEKAAVVKDLSSQHAWINEHADDQYEIYLADNFDDPLPPLGPDWDQQPVNVDHGDKDYDVKFTNDLGSTAMLSMDSPVNDPEGVIDTVKLSEQSSFPMGIESIFGDYKNKIKYGTPGKPLQFGPISPTNYFNDAAELLFNSVGATFKGGDMFPKMLLEKYESPLGGDKMLPEDIIGNVLQEVKEKGIKATPALLDLLDGNTIDQFSQDILGMPVSGSVGRLRSISGEFANEIIKLVNTGPGKGSKPILSKGGPGWEIMIAKHIEKNGSFLGMGQLWWDTQFNGPGLNFAERNMLNLRNGDAWWYDNLNYEGGHPAPGLANMDFSKMSAPEFELFSLLYPQALRRFTAPGMAAPTHPKAGAIGMNDAMSLVWWRDSIAGSIGEFQHLDFTSPKTMLQRIIDLYPKSPTGEALGKSYTEWEDEFAFAIKNGGLDDLEASDLMDTLFPGSQDFGDKSNFLGSFPQEFGDKSNLVLDPSMPFPPSNPAISTKAQTQSDLWNGDGAPLKTSDPQSAYDQWLHMKNKGMIDPDALSADDFATLAEAFPGVQYLNNGDISGTELQILNHLFKKANEAADSGIFEAVDEDGFIGGVPAPGSAMWWGETARSIIEQIQAGGDPMGLGYGIPGAFDELNPLNVGEHAKSLITSLFDLSPNGPNVFADPDFDWGFARGGHVRGPGTGTSDSIPAMLSDGEFVMRSDAVRHWGVDRLQAMNRYAGGGLVGNPPPPDPDGLMAGTALGANTDTSKLTEWLNKPLLPRNPESGSSDPDAFRDLSAITPAKIAGTVLSPKGGGGGASASAPAPRPKDPRAILGAAPTSDSHVNPALAGVIKGAFNTVGSLASTAASLAAAGSTSGASAAIPGGSAAASALISAGTQMAGDVAVGAANVISSFLVGTVTPSQTGQGYGAPLLPQQQPGGGGNNFQSIHNGNVVTNNLSEYSRLKDRKDAQKAAPFFNRVNQ